MLDRIKLGGSRTGVRLCDLPNELLDNILALALDVPSESFDQPLPSLFNRSEFKCPPSSRALEVCSIFRDIGCRHLYETVVLRSRPQVLALVRTLQENSKGRTKTSPNGLYRMIKRLRVENAPHSPVSEVLQLCQNVTHLWVNAWGGYGIEASLETTKIVHITIWDVQMEKTNNLESTRRGGFVSELCTMIRCSRTLSSLKYHRPRQADAQSMRILSSISASSLRTVTLPSRPLRSGPDRDLNLFGVFLKMKTLAHLRVESEDHRAEDFYSSMPDCCPLLLKKLSVHFGPSDLDAPSRTFSFDLNRFDLARKMALPDGHIPQFSVLQLLIAWYSQHSDTTDQFTRDWEALTIVDRRPRSDWEIILEIKADYLAFSGFLHVHLSGLKRLIWETDWDPFRGGTADTVACGLEKRLPMLEILEYRSSERHFLDTLCTMSLPRLSELRLPGSGFEQAGLELFLWVHGYKLTKLEIDLGTYIKGLLAELCPNLQELTIRVTGKDWVDLRNFSEVVNHAKLKLIRVLHEGGNDGHIMKQLSFLTVVDFTPFKALTGIQIQCRWPSAPTRWNRQNNCFVRLAQTCCRLWRIRLLDESRRAWECCTGHSLYPLYRSAASP